MKAILKIKDKEIEVEVSEETIEHLTKKKGNPFARVGIENSFYKIDAYGYASPCVDCGLHSDDLLFKTANYCTDSDLLQQQAWRETLNRLLWRWQYENDGFIDWENVEDNKFIIEYDFISDEFVAAWCHGSVKENTVYFSSDGKAYQAIEEVVKPFMAEHPDFVW